MRSQLWSNKERIGFVLFATIIGSLVWLTHSSASELINQVNNKVASVANDAPQKGQSASSCPSCSPAKQRMIYAPLIDLPESSGSEIVLNCRSDHDLTVTPIFYTREGNAFTGNDITLHPAEIRFVDTKSLIPARERNRHKWGGMAFSYYGGFMEAWAQLTLHGIRGGSSVNVLFSVLSQKRSNTAEAVWWTPRGGSAVIGLGNSSDQQVHASLIFSTGESQTVDIPPFGTEIVRTHSNVLGVASPNRVEAVSVNYTGPDGSLIPSGYTASDDGKFASMIRFYDTQHVVQQDLFANNLRVTGAVPHMVLRNVSSDFITASPTFLPASGDLSKAVKLESVRLAPSEIREIELSALLRSAVGRSDLDSVSVQVGNSGNPGSLIGALYSIGKKNGVTYDVPLRDSGPPRASTGGYPIRLDGDYTTVISITNTTDKQGDFTMQINYDGGPYVIGMIRLAPGATKMFDIRKIRDEQKPDANGHPLPRNLEVAQAKWSIRHNIRLNGRSEVVSLRDGVSSSYSCSLCCPNTFGAGWIAPINYGDCPNLATPGGTVQYTAFEEDVNGPYCGGNGEPYSVYANWETEDESIATVDYNGLATAVGPGAGTVACYWDVVYWTWDDIDESCDEDDEPFEAEDCMSVNPVISGPHTLWYFNGESPSGYSTQITLTTSCSGTSWNWSVTSGSGKITLGSNGSCSITVTSAARSGSEDDVGITVTVSGFTSDTFHLTVRAPYTFYHQGDSDSSNSSFGYRSLIGYEIRDQFGTVLPSDVPVREHFTTGVTSDYSGTNWARAPEGGISVTPSGWDDKIDGQPTSGATPTPIAPCSPLCNILVHHFDGEWYVGSTSVAGTKVQTNTWNRYTDHARHSSVVSPIPPP